MTREDLAKENNSNRIMLHYEPILSTIRTKMQLEETQDIIL
jgi:hypothetical protein